MGRSEEHGDGGVQGHPEPRRGPRALRVPDLASQAVIRAPLVTALLGTLGAVGAAAAEPPPIVVPSGFRVEIVADGLGAPRMLAQDASGTLLVSIPSEGRVVALPASPRPRTPVTVAAGLQLPHGLIVRDGHLWVGETGRVLRFRYDGATHRATEPVVIVPDLPPGAHHWTRSIAFGPDGRTVRGDRLLVRHLPRRGSPPRHDRQLRRGRI